MLAGIALVLACVALTRRQTKAGKEDPKLGSDS
jgi:hypothetical protein